VATLAFWRAWSIWAVSVAVLAATGADAAIYPLPAKLAAEQGSQLNGAVGVVFIAAFASVGALLAWKRPSNPIGWLLSATGLVTAVAAASEFLAHYRATVTLGDWLGCLYLFGFGLCVFVLLVFPTGQLPSRRWRPVAWAAATGLAGWLLGCAFAPTIFTFSPTLRNPVGVAAPAGHIFEIMALGGAVLMAGTGAAAVASLAVRYRRAGTTERAQLKWLLYAAAVIMVALLVSVPIASSDVQNAVSSGAVSLVPVAIGIAVMRYRLYDIDRVISRTVAYAIVTGLLVGLYAGLVLLATEVLRLHAAVAVAAATLAAVALFSPMRRRVQQAVDRRFNRVRYDGDRMVEAFAARLKDEMDVETVSADLVSVVTQALEPAHLSLWVSATR
jgi:hypothetical protein